MGIPATLSTVPAQTPYIQYVATSGQTVFPYPFEITQDSDLVVVANGTTPATDSGYTLSGVGNSTGGNLTFTSGRTVGDIITLYRNIPIERLTQFAQNGGFSSTAFNAEFNNVYLLLQQLQSGIDQCLQIPNTNNPAPTTALTPANYAGKYLSFDSNGNPTPAVLTSTGTITQSLFNGFLSTATAAASNALSYKAGTLSVSGTGNYVDATTITLHAIYSFIAQPTIDYRGGDPIYGHAAFADFSAIVGAVSSDHAHAFQASTQYSDSGTLGRLSGFYSRQDVSGSGAVTELSHFRCDEPTMLGGGTPAIENQYGVYIGALTRGVGNYAFYADGKTKSFFSGDVLFGAIDTPATIRYNYTNGNLELVPRDDAADTYYTHIQSRLYLGSASTTTAAQINSDANTGTLIITPRATYGTKIAGGMVEITNSLTVDSSLGIFGAVPPVQPQGYGTPTGGSHQGSFAAGSITLPNLAAAVAQLIVDLKTYGILGA